MGKMAADDRGGVNCGAIRSRMRLLFWELTGRCNLRCVHCRAGAAESMAETDDLSTAECRTLIDGLAAFAKPILVLTGGEPLLRPDIFEIARHAADRGLPVALATNGTLVDAPTARRIADAGVRRVSVSIDGETAAVHDSFRGVAGSFDGAIEGFKRLKAAGVQVQINTTVVRSNVEGLPRVLDLALKLGADALHVFMLVPVGCGLEIAEREMIGPDECERWLEWLSDRMDVGGIELKATCAPQHARIMRRRAAEGGGKPDAAASGGCLAGSGVCFVRRNGEVWPCGYFPVAAGSVRRTPLQRIWEGAQLFESLRDRKLLTGTCGACEYREECGGCRARAYAVGGDYLAAEPNCVWRPACPPACSQAGRARHGPGGEME